MENNKRHFYPIQLAIFNILMNYIGLPVEEINIPDPGCRD